MIRYFCNLCQQEIDPGHDGSYLVRMEVYAAQSPEQMPIDDDRDHLEEFNEVLERYEEFEEDGLLALAKTIIDRAEEQISLESELGKLRGVEEESDMIVLDDTNLEAINDEVFAERVDEPIHSEVLNNQSRIEPGQDAVACAESSRESITKRDGTRSQSPTQLVLFAYVS